MSGKRRAETGVAAVAGQNHADARGNAAILIDFKRWKGIVKRFWPAGIRLVRPVK